MELILYIDCPRRGNPKKHPHACAKHCRDKCDAYRAYEQEELERWYEQILQEKYEPTTETTETEKE